jgi:cellulose synthase/poly-beta-1,6-N-acetylglucosamine synthase-like glycosyltransferase
MRLLILLGLAALAYFLFWFADARFIGNRPLYVLLAIALGYKLIRLLHEWYHYWRIEVSPRPPLRRDYTVDVLTTFCAGEPYDMVVDTLKAMTEIRYPHTNYLCDEADDPYLKEVCRELGVLHVTRTQKIDAKAGNINHALRQARGEIAVVLDPDHRPVPEFLDQVLPYFQDPQVGFVQCVQAYKNRNESFIAKGAAQQTYHFYGPMMMSMNAYGTTQAIGANCSFRRAALDSIGGHAAGLSEDMHTAMRLHAKGWKSVYVPEALTRGLVPATLSAYYKQQLKWSRGTFELLFFTLPKLWKGLSGRQKLHYLTIPLFFLAGLVTLIDLIVPILALLTSRSPWYIDFNELLRAALPLISMVILIRQYAQRWLLEEHERGFHFVGGSLLAGTWWVFLTGLIYTLLRIRVPYIPTPKDDAPVNEWRLSLPNIGMILLSLAAIGYGLYLDWSPYSQIMAGYAAVNVAMLGFVVLVSQQKLLSDLYGRFYGGKYTPVRDGWYHFRHRFIYGPLRKARVGLPLGVVVASAGYLFLQAAPPLDLSKGRGAASPASSPLYLGSAGGGASQAELEQRLGVKPSLLPLSFEIAPCELQPALLPAIQAALQDGASPLLRWPLHAADSCEERFRALARELRQVQGPVMLDLMPGSLQGGKAFQARWQAIVSAFREEGAANVIWVWEPQRFADPLGAFPGKDWVDYLGLRGGWSGAAALSRQLRRFRSGFPVRNALLLELSLGPAQRPQEAAALLDSLAAFKGWLQGLLFDPSPGTLAALDAWKASPAAAASPFAAWARAGGEGSGTLWQRIGAYLSERPAPGPAFGSVGFAPAPPPAYRPPFITQTPEGRALLKDGMPFFIRGVCYNVSHDWRDGFVPLTRSQLQQDLRRIREMGGNAIRRYHPNQYDYNLLSTAEEMEMQVLYGFWFDPAVNYLSDTLAVAAYEREVLDYVQRFRGYQSVLGWCLGNETWSRLKEHFDPICLPAVRAAYLRMTDRIARQIHALDPERPVFAALGESDQLAAQLHQMQELAPSVDIWGINAFYTEGALRVDSLMERCAPGTPYIFTELGADGYWNEYFTERNRQGMLIEPSSFEKAKNYALKWERCVEAQREDVMGAFVYCWKDRWEGSATWHGLLDYKGRLKPTYYALQEAWTGSDPGEPFIYDVFLVPPQAYPGRRPYLPFRAVSASNSRTDLRYEWAVHREDSFEALGRIRTRDGGKMAQVMMPLEPGAYRMYLYVYDRKNHVCTASEPFVVTPEMVAPRISPPN